MFYFCLFIIGISISNAHPALIDPLPRSAMTWRDTFAGCTEGAYVASFGQYSDPQSWCAEAEAVGSWLQADLGKNYEIDAVGTKGRRNYYQCVTKYDLEYSTDGTTFTSYSGNPLDGNNIANRDTEVKHEISPAIKARYLRFTPVNYTGYPSMRIEAYGLPHCDFIHIDMVLNHCSDEWIGLNGRIDNIIANSESFWANNPDQAAAHAIPGYGKPAVNKNEWFEDNKDNLLILSLVVHMFTIIIGSFICFRSGVCLSFINGGEVDKYNAVKNFDSADAEQVALN